MKKILITGGAGFIGSHLAERHLGMGDTVVLLDDLSTGSEGNMAPFLETGRCRFERGDLLTWKGLDAETARADRIYHLAAVVGMLRVLGDPVGVTRVNVLGTERLLESVARSGRKPELLIASSSSVYGHTDANELNESGNLVFQPDSAALTGYALSKLTNEIQARAYRRKHGIPVTIARLFNSVGPRQSGNYGFVLPRFVKQALTGEPLTVFGDGTQTRSFCDVRDAVAALDLLASDPGGKGEPVNVGNPREIRILDLARLVISRAGSNSPVEFLPFDSAYGEHFGQITQRRPVIERLQRLTGFSPEWSLERTIDDLIARNRNDIVPGGRLL